MNDFTTGGMLEEIDKINNYLIPVSEVKNIIAFVRSFYPENIFSPPKEGSVPDAYAASGCRLSCDNIEQELNDYVFKKLSEKSK